MQGYPGFHRGGIAERGTRPGNGMDWLNYHHLLYFWTVAREGSIARAAETLLLAPPTISTQIKALEESLGEKLFERRGRSLVLTEVGQVVYGYADEIFGLGRELLSAVRQLPTGRPLQLAIGVTDSMPKLVAREILAPVLDLDEPVHFSVREAALEEMLLELAAWKLDLVLTDRPAPSSLRIKAFTHELGRSPVVLMAAPSLAERLRGDFPASLDGAPAILTTGETALRRTLDRWFSSISVTPRVVAEFEDPAMMLVFADDELGFLAVPSLIAERIRQRGGLEVIGQLPEAEERFYAITVERKVAHRGVQAVLAGAKARFASQAGGEG
jgi:LysR family transcriptional activator of nhaA